MPDKAYKYSAFISYCHKDCAGPGRNWGAWIKDLLEHYPTVPGLTSETSDYGDKVPARMSEVFVDVANIGACGDLPERISEALAESRVLIVLCSPDAVASEWVAREIQAFKKLGRLAPLVAVVIDGEPHSKHAEKECLPAPLRHHLLPAGTLDTDSQAEVKWADFRGPENTAGATTLEDYGRNLEASEEHSTKKLERCKDLYRDIYLKGRLNLLAGVLGIAPEKVTNWDRLRDEEEKLRQQKALEQQALIARQHQDELDQMRQKLESAGEQARREREEAEARAREAIRELEHQQQIKNLRQGHRTTLSYVLAGALILVLIIVIAAQFAKNANLTEKNTELEERNRQNQGSVDRNTTKPSPQPEPSSTASSNDREPRTSTGQSSPLNVSVPEAVTFLEQIEGGWMKVFAAGDAAKMVEYNKAAILRAQERVGNNPTVDDWKFILSLVHHHLGESYVAANDDTRALEASSESIKIARDLQKNPPTPASMMALARSLIQQGNTFLNSGKTEPAWASFEEAAGLERAAAGPHPGAGVAMELGWLQTMLASLEHKRGDTAATAGDKAASALHFNKSVDQANEALKTYAQVPENDPLHTRAAFQVTSTRQIWANSLVRLSKDEEALAVRRETLQLAQIVWLSNIASQTASVDLCRMEGHLVSSLLASPEGKIEASAIMACAQRRMADIRKLPGFVDDAEYKEITTFLEALRAQLPPPPEITITQKDGSPILTTTVIQAGRMPASSDLPPHLNGLYIPIDIRSKGGSLPQPGYMELQFTAALAGAPASASAPLVVLDPDPSVLNTETLARWTPRFSDANSWRVAYRLPAGSLHTHGAIWLDGEIPSAEGSKAMNRTLQFYTGKKGSIKPGIMPVRAIYRLNPYLPSQIAAEAFFSIEVPKE